MQKDQRDYAIRRVQDISYAKCCEIDNTDQDLRLNKESLDSRAYAKLFNAGKLPKIKNIDQIYGHTSARNLFEFPEIKVDPKIQVKKEKIGDEEIRIIDQIMLGALEVALKLITDFENN